MELNLCYSCMKEKGVSGPCPHCGFDESAYEPAPHHLPPGTILYGKYLIGRVLGEGGFGITYVGWDLNLEMKVAVKEYYPNGFVTRDNGRANTLTILTGPRGEFFQKGVEKFVEEARRLAKFWRLPGIVAVKDYFQENKTAYIVMEFVQGSTLKEILKSASGGRLPAEQIFQMMRPVMKSLDKVHEAGLIHRDISPDNLMVDREGQVMLIDFGAARDFLAEGEKSLSVMLKPGYAPEEQYRSRGKQGPWTDVYSLCATMYRAITDQVPEESLDRIAEDALKRPSQLGVSLPGWQEKALMKGLAVFQKDRLQSMKELEAALYTEPKEEKQEKEETSQRKEEAPQEQEDSDITRRVRPASQEEPGKKPAGQESAEPAAQAPAEPVGQETAGTAGQENVETVAQDPVKTAGEGYTAAAGRKSGGKGKLLAAGLAAVAAVVIAVAALGGGKKDSESQSARESSDTPSQTTREPDSEPEGNKESGDTEVSSNGTFRIGVYGNSIPSSYLGEDGNCRGVEIDVAQEIAESLGMDLEVQVLGAVMLDGEYVKMALDSGEIDCFAGFSHTPERESLMAFSDPYMTADLAVLVNREAQAASSPEDLSGLTAIAVQRDSDAHVYCTYTYSSTVAYDKLADAVSALEKNEVDCVLTSEATARKLAADNERLQALEEPLETGEPSCFCVQRDNQELLDQINEVIGSLEEQGKIDEFIIRHTLG